MNNKNVTFRYRSVWQVKPSDANFYGYIFFLHIL